jgi:hypothetical protein
MRYHHGPPDRSTQLGDVTTNYQLQPGDRVVVGERTLCEELRFWKQTSACPCCDRSKGVQCTPASENYRNRFLNWRPPFALFAEKDVADKELADSATSPSEISSQGDEKALKPVSPTPPSPDDKDFFLPPLDVNETTSGTSAPPVSSPRDNARLRSNVSIQQARALRLGR